MDTSTEQVDGDSKKSGMFVICTQSQSPMIPDFLVRFDLFFPIPLPADRFNKYRIIVMPSNCMVSLRRAKNARNR